MKSRSTPRVSKGDPFRAKISSQPLIERPPTYRELEKKVGALERQLLDLSQRATEDKATIRVLLEERIGPLSREIRDIEKRRKWDRSTDLLSTYGWESRLREVYEGLIKRPLIPSVVIILVFLDIDDFGLVNKRYTREVGDKLLKEFAAVLKESLWFREGLVSRSYDAGDEIMVATFHEVLGSVQSTKVQSFLRWQLRVAQVQGRKILRALKKITLKGYPDIKVSASVGISAMATNLSHPLPRFEVFEADIRKEMLHAETAMLLVKQKGGKGRTLVYQSKTYQKLESPKREREEK